MKILSRKWLRIILPVLAVAAIVLIAAVIQPWNSAPDTQSVLARAQTAASGIKSYRMTFSRTEIGATQIRAEYALPGRFHVILTEGDRTDEYIGIGDTHYMKTGDRPINSELGLPFSPAPGTEDMQIILDQLVDIQVLPDEKIDGTNCFHYLGKVDMKSQIAEIVNSGQWTEEQMKNMITFVKSAQPEVELWIGQGDYLLREMQQRQGLSDGSTTASSNHTLKYYDFNQPITIDPPTDANGQLLPGWRGIQ